MNDLVNRDYFTDHSILKDPYAYFEAIREAGPVHQVSEGGVVIVTGFEEVLQVLKNTDDFSSMIAVQGPAAPLPFEPEGSDITQQIATHQPDVFGSDLLVTYDGQAHNFSRAILNRLFTPSRLKASEKYIALLSDKFVQDALAKGGCELIKDMATPFVTLVIADLLGVPEEDRDLFMEAIAADPTPGSLNSDDLGQDRAMKLMSMYFLKYVNDRRHIPCDDILYELSNAKYPDGSTPDATEIVGLSTFLFAAGQDTSAKLLGNAMRFIVDQPGLQDQLREDPSLIPPLLEEVLRLEGSLKIASRLARKNTRIGDLEVPAGTRVMLSLSAANRDPHRWPSPNEFMFNRPKIKEHVAFGRGAHVCPGAPLARVEVRVLLEKLLANTANIDLVEEKHGSREDRRIDYEASFLLRGLSALHLELTPAAGNE